MDGFACPIHLIESMHISSAQSSCFHICSPAVTNKPRRRPLTFLITVGKETAFDRICFVYHIIYSLDNVVHKSPRGRGIKNDPSGNNYTQRRLVESKLSSQLSAIVSAILKVIHCLMVWFAAMMVWV